MASVLEPAVSDTPGQHLTAMEVAAYLDGAADALALGRIQSHLLECAECRDETVRCARLADALLAPRRRRSWSWIPVAAAAALVLVVARPTFMRPPPEHREPPMTMTVPPRALFPSGVTESPHAFVWTTAPGAYRYQLRVLDAAGAVVWDHTTSDTAATMPAAIALQRGHSYYWRVEAISGYERGAASEQVEFSARRGAP